MLNAIGEIDTFLTGLDEEGYLDSPMARAAVERKMQIIGEAFMQLTKLDPATAAQIQDVRQIIGFRNVLVHGYAVVESRTVYEIAIQRLPELEIVVHRLLDE